MSDTTAKARWLSSSSGPRCRWTPAGRRRTAWLGGWGSSGVDHRSLRPPELPRRAHRRDCCRQSPLRRTRPHQESRQERTVGTRDRTPNPRTKRERVSRSRCAELRKHAQHESLGAHRFHLYYTVTRHKTCHVSGSYISATIRARSTSSKGSHRSGLRPLPRSPGHLDRLDDPAGGWVQHSAVRSGWENWATGRPSRNRPPRRSVAAKPRRTSSLIRNSGRHQHHCRSRARWPEFLIRLLVDRP